MPRTGEKLIWPNPSLRKPTEKHEPGKLDYSEVAFDSIGLDDPQHLPYCSWSISARRPQENHLRSGCPLRRSRRLRPRNSSRKPRGVHGRSLRSYSRTRYLVANDNVGRIPLPVTTVRFTNEPPIISEEGRSNLPPVLAGEFRGSSKVLTTLRRWGLRQNKKRFPDAGT